MSKIIHKILVGVLGLEPRTSSLSETRSNQLSYTPVIFASFSVRQNTENLSFPATPIPKECGGARGTRTLNILLAKQVL